MIVEVPFTPASTVSPAGLAAIVKSWAMKVTVAEWDRGPLEAVRFAEKPVVKPEQVRMEETEEPKTRPVGFRLQIGMLEDRTLVKVMVPEKPLRLVRVTVERPEDPTLTMTVAGSTAMAKSTTLTITDVVWDREPIDAITITV